MISLLHVVGARPNFMKMAAVYRASADRAHQIIVHTGQHYDWQMSGVFFDELGIPKPDVNLDVGSGTHAVQTAEIMIRFEPLLARFNPTLVVVYGDVNSTVAAALVCSKLGVPVAHVEAGLRSGDRSMPEEINRIVTDALADLLLTPSQDANDNLAAEGRPADRAQLVGNVMIDTLVRLLPQASSQAARERHQLNGRFVLVTLHRPSNVDQPEVLRLLLRVLADVSQHAPVIFPVHPRTRAGIASLGVAIPDSLRLLEPLSYLDFLALQRQATLVITDSGGVQEETTFLGVPCLTVRENTERPITTTLGTNRLVGRNPERLREEALRLLAGEVPSGSIPPLWDGHAGERIADALIEFGTRRAAC